jgi:hypothetical protein
MQITQAVLEKIDGNGPFQVKVVRQILWIDQVRYELRELYGIGNSTAPDFDRNDPGKECVICMTEPKDTAVLPCRHMVPYHFFSNLLSMISHMYYVAALYPLHYFDYFHLHLLYFSVYVQ